METRELAKKTLRRNLVAWNEYRARLRENKEEITKRREAIMFMKTGCQDFYDEPSFDGIVLLSQELHTLKETRKDLTRKCKFWKEKVKELNRELCKV